MDEIVQRYGWPINPRIGKHTPDDGHPTESENRKYPIASASTTKDEKSHFIDVKKMANRWEKARKRKEAAAAAAPLPIPRPLVSPLPFAPSDLPSRNISRYNGYIFIPYDGWYQLDWTYFHVVVNTLPSLGAIYQDAGPVSDNQPISKRDMYLKMLDTGSPKNATHGGNSYWGVFDHIQEELEIYEASVEPHTRLWSSATFRGVFEATVCNYDIIKPRLEVENPIVMPSPVYVAPAVVTPVYIPHEIVKIPTRAEFLASLTPDKREWRDTHMKFLEDERKHDEGEAKKYDQAGAEALKNAYTVFYGDETDDDDDDYESVHLDIEEVKDPDEVEEVKAPMFKSFNWDEYVSSDDDDTLANLDDVVENASALATPVEEEKKILIEPETNLNTTPIPLVEVEEEKQITAAEQALLAAAEENKKAAADLSALFDAV